MQAQRSRQADKDSKDNTDAIITLLHDSALNYEWKHGPRSVLNKSHSLKHVSHYVENPSLVTFSLNRVHEEIATRERRRRRIEKLAPHCLFFVFYMAALSLEMNTTRGEMATRAIRESLVERSLFSSSPSPSSNSSCRDNLGHLAPDGCDVPLATNMSFLDVSDLDKYWSWARMFVSSSFYKNYWSNGQAMSATDQNTWFFHVKPINGMTMVQKRVASGYDTRNDVGGTCWKANGGSLRSFAPVCYDSLKFCLDRECVYGREDKSSFGPPSSPSKFVYEERSPGVMKNFPSLGGFWQQLPATSSSGQAVEQVDVLRGDRWLQRSSQWLRQDVTYMIPAEGLYVVGSLQVYLYNTGHVKPLFLSSASAVETYNFNFSSRIGMLILEILTVLTWLLNIAQSWRVLVAYSKKHPDKTRHEAFIKYYGSSLQQLISDVHLLAFIAVVVMRILIAVDPYASHESVSANSITWGSQALLLAQTRRLIDAYKLLSAIYLLVLMVKIIFFASFDARLYVPYIFSHLRTPMLNFALVFFIFLASFAVQATLLFGDQLLSFSDWGSSFLSMLQVLVNGLYGNRSKQAADLDRVFDVSPNVAWLWYYSFWLAVMFLVGNMAVSVMGCVHERIQQLQMTAGTRHSLCPTERLRLQGSAEPDQLDSDDSWINVFKESLRHKHKDADRALQDLEAMFVDMDCSDVDDVQSTLNNLGKQYNQELVTAALRTYPSAVNDSNDVLSVFEERKFFEASQRLHLKSLNETAEEIISSQARFNHKVDKLTRWLEM
uniref:Polycystin cation channel PKD1/PKD2 domain-containing protein n=1 Tax=Guillardia theta TaxID=55529 RepID=A0A7S4L8P3_GUITH|mmetsp:Transcript_39911/g.125372  ORF Transcript_39911/g.125372 Transcript_39911/m.125372 type:complete len:775 (+) Transcript_39911:92-2416(+)